MPLPLGIPETGRKLGLFGETFSKSLSLGDERLDVLLNGGIPFNNNILFISPATGEREILLNQFVQKGIDNEEICIYITTDKNPDHILKLADKYGLALRKAHDRGYLKFIDCYTWTLGKELNEDTPNTVFVPGPNALNDISISLSKIMENASFFKGKGIRVIFNSISTLLLYNDQDVVFKFLQITGARLKSLNSTTIFAMEEGMHDKKVLSAMDHLTDGSLLVRSDKGWLLNASWIGSHVDVPIDFTNNGLIVQ